MLKVLVVLLSLMQALSAAPDKSFRAALAMKTGVLLRLHVVAEDDTAEQQRIKGCVRDAVRDAYAANAPGDGTMLSAAQSVLPALTDAACAAARREGFTDPVAVAIESVDFDARTLDGLTIPAGRYPALMIRLGDAAGHNWWGLVDPAMALSLSAAPAEDLRWDWSLDGFLQALFGEDVTDDPPASTPAPSAS